MHIIVHRYTLLKTNESLVKHVMLGCSKIPQNVAQILTYLPPMRKALGSVDSNEKSNASPQSTGFCTFPCFVLLNPSPCTLHPLDAAFLAREKAKADAECYTALKIAEANKVKA